MCRPQELPVRTSNHRSCCRLRFHSRHRLLLPHGWYPARPNCAASLSYDFNLSMLLSKTSSLSSFIFAGALDPCRAFPQEAPMGPRRRPHRRRGHVSARLLPHRHDWADSVAGDEPRFFRRSDCLCADDGEGASVVLSPQTRPLSTI